MRKKSAPPICILSILWILILLSGIEFGCAGLTSPNLAGGGGSGDTQEETRNNPAPNTEPPPTTTIVVAGGGNCPSGQCTQESHGGTDDSYLHVRVFPPNYKQEEPIEFAEPYPTVTVRFGWGDSRPWEIREKDTPKDAFGSLLRLSAKDIARLCNPDVRVIQDGSSEDPASLPPTPAVKSLLFTASYENSGISYYTRPAIYTCPEDTTQHLVSPPTIKLALIAAQDSHTGPSQEINWKDLIDQPRIKKGVKLDF